MKILTHALVAIALLAGCGKQESPEAALNRAFTSCCKEIEAGKPDEVCARLHPKFAGPDGLDRPQARLYLGRLLKTEKIGVTVVSSRFEIRESSATQTLEALLTSRSSNTILPGDAGRKQFQLRWERHEGEWRLRELKELN